MNGSNTAQYETMTLVGKHAFCHIAYETKTRVLSMFNPGIDDVSLFAIIFLCVTYLTRIENTDVDFPQSNIKRFIHKFLSKEKPIISVNLASLFS